MRPPEQRWAGPLKGKVTRAAKSKDAKKIVSVAFEVIEAFDAHGWPDNWASWRNWLTNGLDYFTPERIQVEDLFRCWSAPRSSPPTTSSVSAPSPPPEPEPCYACSQGACNVPHGVTL